MNEHKKNGNTARIQENVPAAAPNVWTPREAYLLATVCLMAGLAAGYLFRGSEGLTANSPAAVSAAPGAQDQQHATAADLQPLAAPMLAALKVDPQNVEALVQLGNLYYDHHVFPEAITYYSRALELRPNDVNVRTDLGTAIWYNGDPHGAIAQYEKSLAVDPNHAPTLMNIGIVKWNGLGDGAGAIASWEKLLRVAPQFPDRQRVQSLIAQARSGSK
jgi:cytochrome c-type biogenesis protein CcmH/NrfG